MLLIRNSMPIRDHSLLLLWTVVDNLPCAVSMLLDEAIASREVFVIVLGGTGGRKGGRKSVSSQLDNLKTVRDSKTPYVSIWRQ